MKSFDDITAMYGTYDELVASFKKMSPADEDYEVHKRLIAWCRK